MGYNIVNFPPQMLPLSKKNKAWRKQIMDWADNKTFFNYSLVRKSVMHKKINYDLMNGKLKMSDLSLILNPENLQIGYIPDKIQHYPIINAKLNVLRGEESSRVFDYKVVITNANVISDIKEKKKKELTDKIQQWIKDTSMSDDESKGRLQSIANFFTYDWQDMREVRANCLLNHYVKEYNIPLLFNKGFMDSLIVGEEMYQCDIIGGEPTIERLNPLKVRIFRSGYSNKIEDADMIILEDYWSPGKVIDTFHESLTQKDMDYIEKMPDNIGQSSSDSMDNIDERHGFINNYMVGDEMTSQEGFFWDPMMNAEGVGSSLMPYDTAGNLRVLRVFWKSKRRIKKVKSYDEQTGDEIFNFYPEDYIIDKDKGEEEEFVYINQAWEGVKIGEEIYVNMRPRTIQYNRLSDPSRCHLGIVGTIYNLNDDRPFSFVDMLKPYAYLYDVFHDRLNKLIARNWGSLLRLDLAKKPKGWDVEKWLYYAKTMGLVVEDSFNEGMVGAATGKLAGGLNNASTGVIAVSDGNQIQQYIMLLNFISEEMASSIGISKQREGQIANRETVGGVERSTLQSSHITEGIFNMHEDTKRRVLEVFLETAKIALRGRSKKFQYLMSDGVSKISDIDGDEFAEADYGLLVDNGEGTQKLNQKLDGLAQAALQNQALSFSSIMKLYSSCSISEKQKMIENEENVKMQQAQEAQKAQQDQMAQELQQKAASEEAARAQEDQISIRENETKVMVAQIAAQAENQKYMSMQQNTEQNAFKNEEKDKEKLNESIRQFNQKMELEKEKLDVKREQNKNKK